MTTTRTRSFFDIFSGIITRRGKRKRNENNFERFRPVSHLWKFLNPARTVCSPLLLALPKGSSIVAHTEQVCFDASSRVQRAACNLQMRWPSRVSTIPSYPACNDVAAYLFRALRAFNPCGMNLSIVAHFRKKI